jgi:hypothetical protein
MFKITPASNPARDLFFIRFNLTVTESLVYCLSFVDHKVLLPILYIIFQRIEDLCRTWSFPSGGIHAKDRIRGKQHICYDVLRDKPAGLLADIPGMELTKRKAK